MAKRKKREDSQPVPTHDIEAAEGATSHAIWRLNARYVLLAVSLNILVATGVVAYDIYDDLDTARVYLRDTASHASHAVQVLRSRSSQPDQEIIDEAVELTACEMALVTRDGHVFYQSSPRIASVLRGLRWPDEDTTIPSSRIMIDSSLGSLSGAWSLGRYNDRMNLLVVVPRGEDSEGMSLYLSYAAAITGIGLLLSIAIMLAASHWMLRKPLVRLIDALTSALVRDVRRRKNAEERANKARLEAERHLAFLDYLLNASEELAIIATNPEGAVRLYNRVAERILGRRALDVVGSMTLDELLTVSQPHFSQGRDSLKPFIQNAEGDALIADVDGQEHIIQSKTSRIVNPQGGYEGDLMVFSDITDARRVEAELQSKQMQLIQSSRMATLGEMAAGVAHELNQPLNNIGLLVSRVVRRLGRDDLGPEDFEFVGSKVTSVQEQVRRAAKIIDHLRVFGRADPAPLTDIDVRDAVQGALDLLGEQLAIHDIELDVSFKKDLPKALGDVSRLEQVLINLVVNAQFALDAYEQSLREQGKGENYQKRLFLRAYEDTGTDGSRTVVVEVEDNGPGMPEDVSSRVFEPFFTTKEVGKGTGLGLSISYGIVREFGGSLSVDTAPDRGTTFRVALGNAGGEEAE